MDKYQSDPDLLQEFPLRSLYFYLTRGCNLKCRHCWIAPHFQGDGKSHPSLDLRLFKSIISQARTLGLSSVKLTGGEPFIHPAILEIVAHIKEENLTLSVESNGTSVTRELAETLVACNGTTVSVSLDGADGENHEWMRGVKGCFQATLNGIKMLVQAGLRPQIIMSLVRKNKDQIEPLIRLAESLGAGSVKFNPVQPTARGALMHREDQTLSIEELIELGHRIETDLCKSTQIHLFYTHPAAFKPLSALYGPQGDGCSTCGIMGILGVLADGSYALCGIGETVPELVFGSAATDSLEKIWLHSPVLMQIREGLPSRLEGVCSRCLMKRLCLGDCVAQNYYLTKNLWAPYWYCQTALDKGLFPQSRLK